MTTANLSSFIYRTSDGYALALGWEQGWAVWTVYGRLTTWAVGGDAGGAEGGEQPASFQDRFMNGIKELVSRYASIVTMRTLLSWL